ncbi:MAG: phage portal protein [Rikenellaceae bacterium]|jgi:hypothetical protein|nr:phage portal protein [Rikenellaceae bacterium]
MTCNRIDPFVTIGTATAENTQYWRWGDDNLFPYALSMLSRRSTIHRRIVNDKADYIAGKGIAFDRDNSPLASLIEPINGTGETLREVIAKLAFDKCLMGNAFLEIITDEKHSFLALFHQDATRCRLAKEKQHVILHHDWMAYDPDKARRLPLYPNFEKAADGTLRTMIHYKDYEPMFENYGVPAYLSGINASAIMYKTDRWNISRLDNSFQLSGIMMLDAEIDNDREAEQILRGAEARFAGNPGQVMFLVKGMSEGESSKFIPISTAHEGDWKDLHAQAASDIVVAHSWFRSLSGLDYVAGFSSERILLEYEIALNTVILAAQGQLLDPIKGVIEQLFGADASSLEIVNRPPASVKPAYMMVWEARKADGLDYDPADPAQQHYIGNLSKSSSL